MPRLSRRGKIIIIALAAILLLALGRLFLPVSEPEVSLPAEEVFSIAGFPITNTMLAAWLSILVLGGVAYAATRRMKLVPKGLQNVVEAVVEALLNFVERVAGKEYGSKFLPVIATIFLFVVANAWLALIPGFMSIGFWHTGEEGKYIEPLFRGANTDINFPLALALLSFVFVEYWGIKSRGFSRYMRKFFNLGPLFHSLGQMLKGKIRSGARGLITGVIEAFAGFIEMLSELIRIVSFTFRLFGNMTAGELLLLMMAFLIPWVAVIPFYGLELFLGFVQALIFGGLTLVFVTIAVAQREEH